MGHSPKYCQWHLPISIPSDWRGVHHNMYHVFAFLITSGEEHQLFPAVHNRESKTFPVYGSTACLHLLSTFGLLYHVSKSTPWCLRCQVYFWANRKLNKSCCPPTGFHYKSAAAGFLRQLLSAETEMKRSRIIDRCNEATVSV